MSRIYFYYSYISSFRRVDAHASRLLTFSTATGSSRCSTSSCSQFAFAHPDSARQHRKLMCWIEGPSNAKCDFSISLLQGFFRCACPASSSWGQQQGVVFRRPAVRGPGQPPLHPVLFRQFGHVIMVVEENHSYSEVIGNSAMPYLNSLASQYGLATQYFANTHPSIGNYFMLTTGQLVTNDDGFTGTVGMDNIVRNLIAAGKTWKSYAESIPSTGYIGGDSYPYAKRHNPFAYFADVVNSSTQVNNLVSLSQFTSDLANDQLPNFSYLVPNLLNDAHDGSLQLADAWLQRNIAPLISSAHFRRMAY